ncbi:MAG: ATP-binding protein [Bacteroidetes bacterium]|nr:ATP-binding protein [Bacteroidota bacterium]
MKKFPIGIQSFREIITKNFLYIDKTRDIFALLESGKFFFLARPRRFGKSLLLSTIREIFTGNKELFQGLWIENQWNWQKKHPVIHIGFSSIGYKELGLAKAIEIRLNEIASEHGIVLQKEGISQQFEELIKSLSAQNQTVLLIDEYDKPIIDFLGKDLEKAKEHQQILKTFYSVIKDSDPYIRFLLITGVSKFSKVSIFSELNNLFDITLNRKYVNLLGITEAEISHDLAEYLPEIAKRQNLSIDQLREKIRTWYNGYSWDGENFVYNPFSLLVFLDEQDFRNYWFETGTPTFLLDLMREENFYQVEQLSVDSLAFSSYDIERLRIIPILFQTGYLTIKAKAELGQFILDYPNKEVRDAMYGYLLGDLRKEEPSLSSTFIIRLRKAFYANDLPLIIDLLKSLFAKIPYDIFIANQEAYYHSLLYITFQFLGSYAAAEVNTHRGRIDVTLETPTDVYIIEFKLDDTAEAALKQIKQNAYYEKFLDREKQIRLLGIVFSSKEKSISDWKLEMKS